MIQSFPISATQFLFQAPEGAPNQLGVLIGSNLVSYFRTLPLSFVQSAVSESADFAFLPFLKRVLAALPSEFDDVLDEAMESTTRDEAPTVLCAIYKTPTDGNRDADTIIADCVRAWTSRASDEEGSMNVACALDIVFI